MSISEIPNVDTWQHLGNRFMKVTNELPNTDTWSHLGSRALYLVATLPEEERDKPQQQIAPS